MAGLAEIGEDPRVWADIIFVHESWTWSELQAAPSWVVDRAMLWANTLGAWRKAKQEAEKP